MTKATYLMQQENKANIGWLSLAVQHSESKSNQINQIKSNQVNQIKRTFFVDHFPPKFFLAPLHIFFVPEPNTNMNIFGMFFLTRIRIYSGSLSGPNTNTNH